MKKRIGIGLLALLLLIQVFRPEKNQHAAPQPAAIAAAYPPGPQVSAILEKACYDCHSNNTRYPWYAEVQPVGWWLQHHVNEGKAELNFDEFGTYAARKQARKLEESAEMVDEGEMPLPSYTWVHRDAKLTKEEKAALLAWVNGIRQQLGVTGKGAPRPEGEE